MFAATLNENLKTPLLAQKTSCANMLKILKLIIITISITIAIAIPIAVAVAIAICYHKLC